MPYYKQILSCIHGDKKYCGHCTVLFQNIRLHRSTSNVIQQRPYTETNSSLANQGIRKYLSPSYQCSDTRPFSEPNNVTENLKILKI